MEKLTYAASPSSRLASRADLLTTFCIEGLFSIAGNLLFVGVFFYTTYLYQWGILHNLLLAAGQGLIYIPASLVSQNIAHRLGARKLIFFASSAMVVVTLIGATCQNQTVFVCVILAYVPLLGVNWPVLESLASAGADTHRMARRISIYNLVWAGTGALAMAAHGTLLKFNPRVVFLIPTCIHFSAILILLIRQDYGRPRAEIEASHPHLAPEPQLLRHRTLALWLSRIALPSTYVVLYSLSALMPLLPVMNGLDTSTRTLVSSIWMISRFGIFFVLGTTAFWHTRPGLLFWTVALSLPVFVGTTIPLSWLGTPAGADLVLMILCQAVLGACLGVIYMASLYFGMVLSDGSTEHAGYHEALIGLGQTLGPATGAITQWKWPSSLKASVSAVSAIIFSSVILAAIAMYRARQSRKNTAD